MLQQRIVRSLQAASRQCLQQQERIAPLGAFTSARISAPIATRASFAASQRWYSTEKISNDQNSESNKEAADVLGADGNPAKTGDAAAEDPVKKELETKKKELLDMTDRYKRSVADYRNLQEQTKREVQAAKDFALQRFAKELLDSVDNLDRALSTVPKEKLTSENPDLVSLHDGLKMTEDILLKTLKKNGLERFDPAVAGDVFDPNKHEATFMTPQPDKKDNTVFFTQSKGFLYNGRVIRAAKVGVVKNS